MLEMHVTICSHQIFDTILANMTRNSHTTTLNMTNPSKKYHMTRGNHIARNSNVEYDLFQ